MVDICGDLWYYEKQKGRDSIEKADGAASGGFDSVAIYCNVTTSTVTGNIQSTMGQNPAVFFPDVNWQNKNPYSASYSGYRD